MMPLRITSKFGAKTQATARVGILITVTAGFALLCAGCFTGPKYGYVRQADSASIVGPAVPLQGPENGSCGIVLGRVDGMATNFTASHRGLNAPFFNANDRLFLAPGKHSLDLSISDSHEYYGNVGGGQSGLVATDTAGATPTITVDLMAGHVYRLGANLEGPVIKITLWDETNGVATRTSAATWTVSSNAAYMQATPR